MQQRDFQAGHGLWEHRSTSAAPEHDARGGAQPGSALQTHTVPVSPHTCGMEGSPFLLHVRPGNINNAHLVLVWGATEPSSRVTQRKRIVFWQGSSKVWRPWESSRMRVVRGKVSRS